MKADITAIKARVARGLVSEQKHPTADLYIYNYTPVCQFSRMWDEVTLACRGLIVDGVGNIIARPFPKFFNLEEHTEPLPKEPFSVAEKMDGSLGIMYPDSTNMNKNGQPQYRIATRGSFTSDQAIVGTQMLNKYIDKHGHNWIDPRYTYLFEIIYPNNRVVVDYGDAKRLVLLACINTETGAEDLPAPNYTDIVASYDMPDLTDPADLHKLKLDKTSANREGVVVRFASGLRVKLKFAEYVRLHRILTQTSSKVVWEIIAVEAMILHDGLSDKDIGYFLQLDINKVATIRSKNGAGIKALLANVPDEFYKWLFDLIKEMTDKQAILMSMAQDLVAAENGDRLKIVSHKQTQPLATTMALLLIDGKVTKAHGLAWRTVKPEWAKPFAVDIDA